MACALLLDMGYTADARLGSVEQQRGCFRFHVTGDRRKWAPAGGSSAAARSAARSMIFRPQTDELELAYV